MNLVRPTNITLNRNTGCLILDWSDGSQCEYPLDHLREACPCVDCRGGHQNMGMANAPDNILTLTPVRSYKVQNLEVVGNYALKFFWDDGHNAGIYAWEYLYHLCPQSDGDQGE